MQKTRLAERSDSTYFKNNYLRQSTDFLEETKTRDDEFPPQPEQLSVVEEVKGEEPSNYESNLFN